jgi:2-hydroxy-6-oxonona-2,4-dienedioate hydrolase
MTMMKILKVLLLIIAAVSLLPYLIPLPKPDGAQIKIYENSRYASIDGTSLHFRVWEPSRPIGKILMVHGLAGSTFSFRNNVQPLVDAGYRVVAVDLPGFGYSSRARKIDHSQENRAKLLWGLLDQLDAEHADNGKWHLLGHSMGAGTITAMTLSRETRVASMTYVDGAVLPGNSRNAAAFIYPPARRWFQVIGRYVLLDDKRIRQFLGSAYGRSVSDDELIGYLAPLKRPGTEGTFVDMLMTSTDLELDQIRKILVPVTGIWGEKDTWVPVSSAYELENLISGFQLHLVADAWHCPMETKPDEFNEILLGALRR